MMQESEKLFNWLKSIKFEEYYTLFQNAAYDLQTISRMTPEDLTAIGITKPEQRRKLKNEINKLQIEDGIPAYWPNSVDEWLEVIRLTDYVKKLNDQGYTTLEKILELTWEDLEEIGIKKLGHQKRIMLAIKKLQSLAKGSSSISQSTNHAIANGLTPSQLNHYSSASSLQSSVNLNSSLNSLNSSHSTTSKSSSILHANLYLPLQAHAQPIYGVHTGHLHQPYQEVAINTNRNPTNPTKPPTSVSPEGQSSNNVSVNSSASIAGLINANQNGTPTTTELKTFQQLSTASSTSSTCTATNVQASTLADQQPLVDGSKSCSSNSLTSSLNNSSNSAMNLPPLLLNGQYNGYLSNGNVNSYHQLITGTHPQIINGQLVNGQLINGQLINHNGLVTSNGQINQLVHPQVVMINRGRSMESLPHCQQQIEPIYGIRQIVNGKTATAIVDGQTVQVIYANANHLQQQQQHLHQQQQNQNEMYLIYNNDMDGTATLNRPKSLIKNRPVAKIAAKTRDLNGMTDANGMSMTTDSISEQKQAILANQQIYGNLNGLNNNYSLAPNDVVVNNMINANMNEQYGQYGGMENTIYENNVYIQEQQKLMNNGLGDRNSYNYATLKRNKKVPPPIPKRTNSMRTNGQQQQLPLTAPTTPSAHAPASLIANLRRGTSLEDTQQLLNHQLNQLALAQKLKQQLNNQRSSCSSLEVMQEDSAFALCVKSLTSRFSMNSSSLDDDDLSLPSSSSVSKQSSIDKSSSSGISSGSSISNGLKTTNTTSTFEKKDEATRTPIVSPATDLTKVQANGTTTSGGNQLANCPLSVTTTISSSTTTNSNKVEEKLNLVNDDPSNHPLNESTGSTDFPPLPSPPLLLNENNDSNSQNNSLTHPLPTTTPPLPSPPVLDDQQTHQPPTKVDKSAMLPPPPPPVSNHHQSLNNVTRTLGPQQLIRQQQFKQANNQVFKFDQQAHFDCTVSSSSSTESMLCPFANDSVGTIVRPKPGQCANANAPNCYPTAQQQLNQFASSSSSSSICSSSSMTSSSTSSSLSSVSSNLNALNNGVTVMANGSVPTSFSSSSLNQPASLAGSSGPPPLPPPPTNHHHHHPITNALPSHQAPYQPLAQASQQPLQSLSSQANNAGNKIEHVVRSSVNCISNLGNHLNLTKLITSTNSANTAFRSLLGKPVQPPQVPAKPALANNNNNSTITTSTASSSPVKNWPCSPVKQLTSPEHVPNVNQFNGEKSQIPPPGPASTSVVEHAALSNGDARSNNLNSSSSNASEATRLSVVANHDNFRSQPPTNQQQQSSHLLTNDYTNGIRYQSSERSTTGSLANEKNVTANGYRKYIEHHSNSQQETNNGTPINGSTRGALNAPLNGNTPISNSNLNSSSLNSSSGTPSATTNGTDTIDDIEMMLANLSS